MVKLQSVTPSARAKMVQLPTEQSVFIVSNYTLKLHIKVALSSKFLFSKMLLKLYNNLF
jgi:hypothetical protein